ncbi:putative SUR7 family protein FMP45 [Xylogone sp. PMI_703]|nr:putative SUR7 family protein FMP45 [Xylogone sp. PMI_703]
MGLVSLVLIGASILFILFVVLSGVTHSTPLSKTYFLQADTSRFPGSGRPLSQWTYFYICGNDNRNCGSPVPALPFGYAWVGGTQNVPSKFVGHHGKGTTSTYFYYMWRFGWVFFLMGLVFDVFAFFTSLLAPCSRLASGISSFILYIALFWFTLGAALMTATFVRARDIFHENGLHARLGSYAFGWTWAAWACMFLASLLLCLGCLTGRDRSRTTTTRSRGWGRGRRTRGSLVDSESQHRVKDEY